MTHWLSPGMLPACRSGDDEPNGGVAFRNGAITREFFFRHCRGLTAAEDSGTSWDDGCDGRNKTTIKWFAEIENTAKPLLEPSMTLIPCEEI